MPAAVAPKVLAAFQALFEGRASCYGQWAPDNIKTLRTAPPDEAWVRHLTGSGPRLGIVPIREDNSVVFGAIDFDDDACDHAALAATIAAKKLPLNLCRSKSGGAHLYLFFDAPVAAQVAIQHLKRFTQVLQLANIDQRPMEIFPKQFRLKPQDTGNWINLPYYGALSKTGTTTAMHFEGKVLDLPAFLTLAAKRRVDTALLEAWRDPELGPFLDGPPCLAMLHKTGYGEGERNNGLYNVAIFMKLKYPSTWQEETRQYNHDKMDPPLSKAAVEGLLKSIDRGDYCYKCRELPIQDHCNKTLCKKQAFGVDALKAKLTEDEWPETTGLVKVLTDPPRWRVTVSGLQLELSTDELYSQTLFAKRVLEGANVMLPPIRVGAWTRRIGELLQHVVEEEAPKDAGQEGQFWLLVSDFLMLRLRSHGLEDLLQGKPVAEHQHVLFRSSDLLAFMERRRFTAYAPNRVYTLLRKRGGKFGKRAVKGAMLEVWSLPLPAGEQSEPFTVDVPTDGRPEF